MVLGCLEIIIQTLSCQKRSCKSVRIVFLTITNPQNDSSCHQTLVNLSKIVFIWNNNLEDIKTLSSPEPIVLTHSIDLVLWPKTSERKIQISDYILTTWLTLNFYQMVIDKVQKQVFPRIPRKTNKIKNIKIHY